MEIEPFYPPMDINFDQNKDFTISNTPSPAVEKVPAKVKSIGVNKQSARPQVDHPLQPLAKVYTTSAKGQADYPLQPPTEVQAQSAKK
ncbi:MAG: hypothetical protein ACI9RZ_001806 [Sphingobacteriales bacterium]|jgi:hypothetical protein